MLLKSHFELLKNVTETIKVLSKDTEGVKHQAYCLLLLITERTEFDLLKLVKSLFFSASQDTPNAY